MMSQFNYIHLYVHFYIYDLTFFDKICNIFTNAHPRKLYTPTYQVDYENFSNSKVGCVPIKFGNRRQIVLWWWSMKSLKLPLAVNVILAEDEDETLFSACSIPWENMCLSSCLAIAIFSAVNSSVDNFEEVAIAVLCCCWMESAVFSCTWSCLTAATWKRKVNSF